jgi:hypothetical protein
VKAIRRRTGVWGADAASLFTPVVTALAALRLFPPFGGLSAVSLRAEFKPDLRTCSIIVVTCDSVRYNLVRFVPTSSTG